ncbi:MAG: amidohydrolase [Chloroflexi bacterium]|nr:amidohydrolase [Chloroflexota bacterium]
MGMPEGIKIIDALVMENRPGPGSGKGSRHRHGDIENQIPGYRERFLKGTTIDEMVAIMDEVGIEKAMLEVGAYSADFGQDSGLKAVEKYPDRFSAWCSDLAVNPHEGMGAVRKLQRLVSDFGVKFFEPMPGRVRLPPNDKQYYPLYYKCIELGIPVVINVGIPGPHDPAWLQDPIHLDEVCWFFPDLRVVMCHIGEPWQFMCVKLMLKWPNLYYMTSAFAPKHYPGEIIYYMNTRGADKVMFASGYPIIDFRRAALELKDLPLRDHVWPKFVRENAIKVFKL